MIDTADVDDETRSLTDAERAQLCPEIEQSDIPVVVVKRLESDDGYDKLNGKATGWLPGRRQIQLDAAALDRLDELALRGLYAHELGHHRKHHPIIGTGAMVAMFLTGLGAVVGGFLAYLAVGPSLWSIVAFILLFMTVCGTILLVSTAVSRWYEYAADRTAVAICGSTTPIKALISLHIRAYERPTGLRERLWAWVSIEPSPANRLDAIQSLDTEAGNTATNPSHGDPPTTEKANNGDDR